MRRVLAKFGVAFCALLLVMSAHGQPGPKIVFDGSTGVMPLAAALAKAFQERNPPVTTEMGKGLGTKARIDALSQGKIDIAIASHGLDAAEIARRGMAVHEFARVPVVFGVNATVPVGDLSEAQVCDVYAGKISSWKALGGPDLAIEARTRPDTEVDAEVVRANIKCFKDLSLPPMVKVMPRGGDMAKELAATAGAIGMTTMTVVEQSQGRIRAVTLNGLAPSPGNIEGGRYPLVRQSFFIVKMPPSPEVARFLEFARSAAGAEVIEANGAIPLK